MPGQIHASKLAETVIHIPGIDMKQIKVLDGGPQIRLGRNEDGGYVLPARVVDACTALVSLGISTEWSFEADFARRKPDTPILGFDPSISPKKFRKMATRSAFDATRFRLLGKSARARLAAERVKVARDYFHFFKGNACHYPYRITDVSGGTSKTFADVIALVPPEARTSMIVKVDIEGSEYRVLPDVVRFAAQIDCLLVEFHDTDICAAAFDAIIAGLAADFAITHVHANNIDRVSENGFPRAAEITFLNRRLMPSPERRVQSLPVAGLDFPNDPSRPEIDLSFLCKRDEA